MAMQIISVVGALMVLVAYGLIQAGTWRELDAGYLALNILGSLLLGIVAIEDRRVGFVLLEFAWAGIALVGSPGRFAPGGLRVASKSPINNKHRAVL
jgi:fluoride ion exporter CrcB/FEX